MTIPVREWYHNSITITKVLLYLLAGGVEGAGDGGADGIQHELCSHCQPRRHRTANASIRSVCSRFEQCNLPCIICGTKSITQGIVMVHNLISISELDWGITFEIMHYIWLTFAFRRTHPLSLY